MSEIAELIDSPVWDSLSTEFSEVAGTFLMAPFRVASSMGSAPMTEISSGIKLASTAYQAEIRIALATDNASAGALAEAMFGEDSPELMVDLFQELANMWMGAIKSAFGSDEVVFTGGLPIALTADKFEGYLAGCIRQEEILLKTDNAKVAVRIGLNSKKNSDVSVAALREGMVVAKDLCNDGGMLLIAAGTRLSARSVGRLTSMLPNNKTVTVAGVVG